MFAEGSESETESLNGPSREKSVSAVTPPFSRQPHARETLASVF
jgi:hypothetical protein